MDEHARSWAWFEESAGYDEDEYGYETTKNIISMSQKLTETDKTLLLALIDMLEAPKAEGDKKLQELKARLPGLLPQ